MMWPQLGDSGFTNFALTVTLDKAVDTGFTLTAATSNGTASGGHDYTATNVLLGFAGAAGETQTVLVPVRGDLIGELDETFNVTLSNLASSGRNVTLAMLSVWGPFRTMTAPASLCSPPRWRVSEPDTTAVFVLTLTSQPTADVAVSLAASDASERCSVPASATLDVNRWQTGVTVTVTAVDDDIVDGDQLCTIELTATSSDPIYDGILIERSCDLADDDTPPPNGPPVIADQSFSIDENSPLGTVVGMVAASDPDHRADADIQYHGHHAAAVRRAGADASADGALAAVPL
ncbi:MAG: Calx-beta domain-containing protein [Caldilineaceae bacterium]